MPAVVVPVALAAWSVVGVYERWQKARGLAAAGRKTDAEARKTDSEGRKIVAETDRTRAETERIRAEIDEARARSLSEQAITHLVRELGIKWSEEYGQLALPVGDGSKQDSRLKALISRELERSAEGLARQGVADLIAELVPEEPGRN